jgi:hypothetical protein
MLVTCGKYPILPVTSVEGLANTNMYAYMLPIEEVENRNWRVEIGPFQLNCELMGEELFKPLFINYYNNEGNAVLQIRLSPDDAWVPPVTPDGRVMIDSGYSENEFIEYHEWSDGGTQFFFQDTFGLDVVVESSTLSANELVELVSSLEYVGAEPENVIVPWRDGCS